MKTLFVILAMLASLTVADAHPNHSCHSHGVTQHCK
jgi:hypothetical protein